METFIVGAGFSKWVHPQMPLMNDLLKSVMSDSEVRRQILDSNLRPVFSHTNSFEALISYLHSSYPWKSSIESSYETGLYEKCIKIAVDALRLAEQGLDFAAVSGERRQIFEYWQKNSSSIITFNYDTIVESGLEKIKEADWFGYYKLPLIDIDTRGAQPDGVFFSSGVKHESIVQSELYPTLVKLHGSINWLHSGNFDDRSENIYYHHSGLKGSNFEIKSKGLRPLIIPPSLDKSRFYHQAFLALNWAAARKYVENAEDIYIVGYSMPESDTYVDMLFKRSLRKGTKIHFVNNDTSNRFKARMKRSFQKLGLELDFRYVCEKSLDQLVAEKMQ